MDSELAAAIAASRTASSGADPDIVTSRALFDAAVTGAVKAFFHAALPQDTAYKVHEQMIPVDGGEILVRCFIPAAGGSSATYPVLVNIHGGGFCVGSIELDDYILRQLCVQLQLSTVNIEYRLAPEHPFPIPLNDCLAALKWTAENPALVQADLTQGFIVCGHSAGANISAVLAHIARDDPFFEGRRLTGQILRDPSVCHPSAYPESLKSDFRSMEENKDVPPVTRSVIEKLRRWHNAPPHDPRYSPLLYPSHKGLPRTYIQAMELDPLRDDALVYGKVLREAGVEVKLDFYTGVSHGFHYNWPALKVSEKVRNDFLEGIRWLLNSQGE
ncbi:hypothetical protein PYCCODRAFT_1442525 [Trametes coccinea BRFM310]|uniref:Alpha/beta hydrolase fold-3 domain-containing protein n=1 Tax=Trametes coccinea (strain BRFM310) TaxID=1353009 RepID=A0A1Y2J2I8_TRAC3|nr:hypothetical protein PYCCODRAFT_1442525 [Trametes coccinea BRFM310]